MKTRLEQQRQLTLAREQHVQNPQLTMVSYDYNQLPQQNLTYPSPYNTLPTQQMIDPTNQYSMVTPYSTQQPLPPSHYSSTMIYSPKTDTNLLPPASGPLQMQPISFPMGANGDNNYNIPSGQLPMTNANMPYIQQQPTPVVNEGKHEPQLITFD